MAGTFSQLNPTALSQIRKKASFKGDGALLFFNFAFSARDIP